MSIENDITVTACTLDKRAMRAISIMFATLADEPQVRVIAEPEKAPLTPAGAPEVNEKASENLTVEVDTAAVFGGAAAAPAPGVAAEPAAAPAPPAPAAAAPPAPPAAAAAPGVGSAPELDKMGLPWDARIHTSNKTKNGSGNWKMKKGLPAGEFDRIAAELKAALAAAPAPAAPAAAAPPAPPAAPPAAPAPAAAAPPAPPAAAPAPPAAPAAAAPAPAAPTQAPATYAELLQVVAVHTREGAAQPMTAQEVNDVCSALGVEGGLATLASVAVSRPDLIGAVYNGCAAIWSTR